MLAVGGDFRFGVGAQRGCANLQPIGTPMGCGCTCCPMLLGWRGGGSAGVGMGEQNQAKPPLLERPYASSGPVVRAGAGAGPGLATANTPGGTVANSWPAEGV